ncbi:hypothetical protein MCOR08_006065 [Pyricularia oryzae]|nr:hypothetical protein MCOR12_005199 [Pyricularia oryzae]KAI6630800.1 hypothetical protein MCOR08_006065 [Pyricularia oryzae]
MDNPYPEEALLDNHQLIHQDEQLGQTVFTREDFEYALRDFQEVSGGEDGGAVSEVSDADSVYLGVQEQINRAQADRTAFLDAFQNPQEDDDEDIYDGLPTKPPPRKKVKRGPVVRKGPPIKKAPRKAKELPTEIKVLVDAATNAFIANRYDEALQAARETIRLNAEVAPAWGILAAVYEEREDWRHALEAKRIQASLTKGDTQLWLGTADLALHMVDGAYQDSPEEIDKTLKVAMDCYRSVLQIDKTNPVARLGKADILADLGQSSKAVAAYLDYLKQKPYNLRVVRSLAEHAYNARRAKEAIEATVLAYEACIQHFKSGQTLDDDQVLDWIDVRIFIELLASLEKYDEAAKWLKTLVRWLVGRNDGLLWDQCQDDREWDLDDTRRLEMEGFNQGEFLPQSYGHGLPLELRGKLAVYRFRTDMEDEAMRHLRQLDPEDADIRGKLQFTPEIAKEVADQLCESGKPERAILYYDLYRDLVGEALDAEYYVKRAKCHVQLADGPAAEDCFIYALEVDEDNIEARYELAKMYEEAQERDEAFRLVGEALSLEAGQSVYDGLTHRYVVDRGKIVSKPKKYRTGATKRAPTTKAKYRPRRLIGGGSGESARKKFEDEVTARLRERYTECQRLKAQMDANVAASGGHDTNDPVVAEWMSAAKELVDDFRSFREFYSWERYVSSLGYGNFFKAEASADGNTGDERSRSIAKMAKRLHNTLAPVETEGEEAVPQKIERQEHRGIPFNDWLDLFLEYAISLARQQRIGEAYAVCQSARDSIVYGKAKDSLMLIHLAWASCAVQAGDEETCVAIARYFMIHNPFVTDGYKMFAALTRVCQTSPTWYQSGPSQKFMLRQIRQMDEILAAKAKEEEDGFGAASNQGSQPPGPSAETQMVPATAAAAQPGPTGVDAVLLVLYGCILFASTSYQYALAYFLRARTVDPDNPAINLVIGLAYIHWALKRQSHNRQYTLMQGFSYIFKYYEDRTRGAAAPEERQEAHYNVARTYHLLGIHDLALEYYHKVLVEARAAGTEVLRGKDVSVRRREDLSLESAMNIRTYCLSTGDLEGARAVTDEWLVLE